MTTYGWRGIYVPDNSFIGGDYQFAYGIPTKSGDKLYFGGQGGGDDLTVWDMMQPTAYNSSGGSSPSLIHTDTAPYTIGATSWSHHIVGSSYVYAFNPYMEYIYHGGYWYFISGTDGDLVLVTADFITWGEMRGPVSHYHTIEGVQVPTYFCFQYFYTFMGSLYAMAYDPSFGEVNEVLGLVGGTWQKMDMSGRTNSPHTHIVSLGYNDSALYATGDYPYSGELWASYDGGIDFTKLATFTYPDNGAYQSFLTSIVYSRGRYWVTDNPVDTNTGVRGTYIYYSTSPSFGVWEQDNETAGISYLTTENYLITSGNSRYIGIVDRSGHIDGRSGIIGDLTLNTEKSVPLDLDTMGTGAYVAVESTLYPNIDVYYIPSTMDTAAMLFSGSSKYSAYGVEASYPGDCVFWGEMLASGWVGIRFINQEIAEYYPDSNSANGISWGVYDDVDPINITICDENNHVNVWDGTTWVKIYDQPYEPYTDSGFFSYHAQERYAQMLYYGTREGNVYGMDIELDSVPTQVGHTDGNKVTCIRVPLW